MQEQIAKSAIHGFINNGSSNPFQLTQDEAEFDLWGNYTMNATSTPRFFQSPCASLSILHSAMLPFTMARRRVHHVSGMEELFRLASIQLGSMAFQRSEPWQVPRRGDYTRSLPCTGGSCSMTVKMGFTQSFMKFITYPFLCRVACDCNENPEGGELWGV